MKQSAKSIRDALKMAYRLDKALPLYALKDVLNAVVPFIAIWLSAYVLDALAAGKGITEMLPTVLLGVGAAFALKIAFARINAVQRYRLWPVYMRYHYLRGDKNMDLDYQQTDDPKLTAMRAKIRSDSSWGSGIANTYWYAGEICAGIARVILSVVTLYPVLSNPVFYTQWHSLVFVALAAAVTALPIVFGQKVIGPREKTYMEKATAQWFGIFHYLGSGFDYHYGKDVRIYDAAPLIVGKVTAMRAEAKRDAAALGNASGLGYALTGVSDAAMQGGAYLLVTMLALLGGLTVGVVVRSAAGFYQLAQGISRTIMMLGELAIDTQRLQSTFEYLDVPNVLYKGRIPVEKRRDKEYEIEFRDVSFQYPGSDAWALRHLHLKLRIGEKLAVVGENGSGKTTMIKLLCRLYDPTEGVITLNGIDIRKYDQQEYFGIFAVVFQDFKLLSLGLGQNVAASDEVDEMRARECLVKAGFGERLDALPDGLATILFKDFTAEGIDISGGEAQKVALARALYKHAPFVILDEPTAALDPIAEFDIYSRFDDIVGDRTAIYISHRLSSCRFCQDIAVFHEGRLIQRGSHDALLADAGGKYLALWHAQAQYYAESQTTA